MRGIDDLDTALWTLSRAAAVGGFWVLAGMEPAYLYFRPHKLDLKIVGGDQEPPRGWELVTSQRIPANRHIDGITSWIRDHINRIPLLPTDEDELDRMVYDILEQSDIEVYPR